MPHFIESHAGFLTGALVASAALVAVLGTWITADVLGVTDADRVVTVPTDWRSVRVRALAPGLAGGAGGLVMQPLVLRSRVRINPFARVVGMGGTPALTLQTIDGTDARDPGVPLPGAVVTHVRGGTRAPGPLAQDAVGSGAFTWTLPFACADAALHHDARVRALTVHYPAGALVTQQLRITHLPHLTQFAWDRDGTMPGGNTQYATRVLGAFWFAPCGTARAPCAVTVTTVDVNHDTPVAYPLHASADTALVAIGPVRCVSATNASASTPVVRATPLVDVFLHPHADRGCVADLAQARSCVDALSGEPCAP